MASSAVLTFTDPDDYAAMIRNTKAEVTVTGRGQFAAKITKIDLHRLWMQRFSDNLPRIGHSSAIRGRTVISFRTQPGPSLFWCGAEMLTTNLVRHGRGESSFQRSSGSASWGAMSLPVAAAAGIGEALAGCDLTPPSSAMLISPSPSAMARLQRLHAAAGQLAENAPEIIAHPEAAQSRRFPLMLAVSSKGKVELIPVPGASALGSVLGQMIGLAETNRLARLKTCASDECQWIFFDRSKPANRHWCSSSRCGNRQKTRAYRVRQRQAGVEKRPTDRDSH